MCPRLHVDRVTLRLVIAYQGAGTEFLSNEDADRRHLGHAQHAGDEIGECFLAARSVRAANTLDVVLLKGEAWPGNEGHGAVHRSPAASHTEPRLVLTLDPL